MTFSITGYAIFAVLIFIQFYKINLTVNDKLITQYLK